MKNNRTPKFFISYRKKETTASTFVHRFAEKLSEQFGYENVFLDEEQLPIGEEFRAALIHAVESSTVIFVIIGPGWVQRLAELNGQEDYVRLELSTALNSELKPKIAPILIGGTTMPTATELPEDIRDFAKRHGTAMDTKTLFHETYEKLIERLNLPGKAREKERPGLAIRWSILTLLPLAAGSLLIAKRAELWHLIGINNHSTKVEPAQSGSTTDDRNEGNEVHSEPTSDDKSDTELEADHMQVNFGGVPFRFQRLEKATVDLQFFDVDRKSTFKKQVTFEDDVWISAAPVTERLWNRVMAPAGKPGSDRPVTNKSHAELFESGGFFRRLNEMWKREDGGNYSLPTEYEWQRLAQMPRALREEHRVTIDSVGFVEWCEDRYNQQLSDLPQVNRKIERRGLQILLRGRDNDNTRGFRGAMSPEARSPSLGFRIVIVGP